MLVTVPKSQLHELMMFSGRSTECCIAHKSQENWVILEYPRPVQQRHGASVQEIRD